MIIGVLGKGGSGKSTVATLLTKYLTENNNTVLAIDADHNMDLAYNLGVSNTDTIPLLGHAYTEIKVFFGLGPQGKFKDGLAETITPPHLSLYPKDPFTQKYAHTINDKLHLMIAGPQIDSVLYGDICSHSLAAPLKLYLPYLHLKQNEFVVVDEKASADAASTGIPTGFDLSVIVIEPREHSVKAAAQIAETLTWFDVPYVYVWNKWHDDVSPVVIESARQLGEPVLVIQSELDPLSMKKVPYSFDILITKAHDVSVANISRKERSQAKYKKSLIRGEKDL